MMSTLCERVVDILHKDCFYKESHQEIYDSLTDLFNDAEPIDILTVTEELKKMNELDSIGGLAYISELTNKIASSSNTEFHARIIAEKFIKTNIGGVYNLLEIFRKSSRLRSSCKFKVKSVVLRTVS